MRYLCIDLGDRRTGFASGDDVVGIVQPLEVAQAPTPEAQVVAALAMIDEYGPQCVVVGLPYNMDGTEGPRALLVREFAAELTRRLPKLPRIALVFQDERLSSFDAEHRLNRTGRTHGEKKALRDALAACAILEDYLRVLRGDASSNEPAEDDA
ncbi:MAG: Holliday junction resolvase RuvX [Phycisphaerales bacterium]|nr:Holliday junction resolvase RuvX [Phycisphaerales bacterium]